MRSGLYRILDANLNRSREGLRVCEEITRFVLDSGTLTKELKSMRHAIATAMRGFKGSGALLVSRDPGADVGRSSRLATEMRRAGYRDLFTANMQRAKESLRVLEECSKLCDPAVSMRFRRLRFRSYEVEKKAAGRLASLQ